MPTRCPFVAINAVSKSADVGSLTKPDNGKSFGSYLYWNADSESGGKWTNEEGSVHLGSGSARNKQTGNFIALGANAGQGSQDNAIAIGESAGQYNQGLSSIAIGYSAGLNNQGNNAIAIGQNSGLKEQGSYSIAIGTNAGRTGQVANSIVLSVGLTGIVADQSGFYVNPIRGADAATGVLSYDPDTSEIRYNGSSQRYKYDICPLEKDTSTIYQLEPREFKYKLSGNHDIGLIAEEVFHIDPSLVYLSKGEPEGIQWNTITTYLLQEMKKLKSEVDELESYIK